MYWCVSASHGILYTSVLVSYSMEEMHKDNSRQTVLQGVSLIGGMEYGMNGGMKNGMKQ